tara:strand:- start:17204 stop:17485 length:282 start_codon:yes stop_codon:yes gene_type:complete
MKLSTKQNITDLSVTELRSLAKCLTTYSKDCFLATIELSGYNEQSGYIYLSLDNGVCIASFAGQEVQFVVHNFEIGEEKFFNIYQNAVRYASI